MMATRMCSYCAEDGGESSATTPCHCFAITVMELLTMLRKALVCYLHTQRKRRRGQTSTMMDGLTFTSGMSRRRVIGTHHNCFTTMATAPLPKWRDRITWPTWVL